VVARPLDRVSLAGVEPAIAAVRALSPLADIGAEWDGHWLLEEWGDAEFVTLTPGLGRYFGTEKGVLVARAPEDATLGLKDGDVIVSIGGREPQNNRHAMRILRSYQPGEAVEIRILRDRRAQTLRASIPERRHRDAIRHRLPAPPASPAPPAPPAPPASPSSPGEPAST
jgi:S1-C subfamily serine protease